MEKQVNAYKAGEEGLALAVDREPILGRRYE